MECSACGRTVTPDNDPWHRRCGCGRTIHAADEVLA
nr:DUF1922 domain-containing protein [Halomarina rubra]